MKKLVPTVALDCRTVCGIRVCVGGGFLRKLGGKKKKAYVRLQRKVKGGWVCVCGCVCVGVCVCLIRGKTQA